MADLIERSFNNASGLLTKRVLEGEVMVTKTFQDIEPNVEMVKRMHADDDYTSAGIKKELAHALHIPEIVQIELLTNGVNIYTASIKEIVAGLRRIDKFDACSVSRKKLWRG